MDICWPKPISWFPWGGNPPNEGCFPKRLGSPPKNNGVNKGFPLVGGVKGFVLEGGDTMVGTTYDTYVTVDVWVVATFGEPVVV
jgi:hypothetical protein